MQQLLNVDEHVKNYRPQVLVLSGLPSSRPPLIDFANLICKNLSMMVCGHIVSHPLNQRTRTVLTQRMYRWFQAHKIKAFYSVADNTGFKGVSTGFLFVCLFLLVLETHLFCFLFYDSYLRQLGKS